MQQFGASCGLLAEDAEHGARNGIASLFLHSAHHHAEVRGFDDDGDAVGFEDAHEFFGDLRCHPLLDLQAARVDVDDAGDFGEADDFSVGDVGDVRSPVKRQHMMLAHGEELDVAHDDDFVGGFMEEGLADDFVDVATVAAGEEVHGLGVTFWGVEQAFALGVFSEEHEVVPHVFHELLERLGSDAVRAFARVQIRMGVGLQ